MGNENKLPIIEIFGPTLQGEGSTIGCITHFVRLAGCPIRCNWCDTPAAVLPELIKQHRKWMSVDEITAKLWELGKIPLITFTGGEPCLHNLGPLISSVTFQRCVPKIAIETLGLHFYDWMHECNYINISPKPPSAQVVYDLDVLGKTLQHFSYHENVITLKVVIFTDADLEFAWEVRQRWPNYALCIQVGNPETLSLHSDLGKLRQLERLRLLTEKVLKDTRFQIDQTNPVRVLPQLHTLIWGNENGK